MLPFTWDLQLEIRESVNTLFSVCLRFMGDLFHSVQHTEPWTCWWLQHICWHMQGFCWYFAFSLKRARASLTQANTDVQRNEDSGRRMACLAATQRAWQLSLMVYGGLPALTCYRLMQHTKEDLVYMNSPFQDTSAHIWVTEKYDKWDNMGTSMLIWVTENSGNLESSMYVIFSKIIEQMENAGFLWLV